VSLAADTPLVQDLHLSPNVERRRNGLRPTILLMHYTGLPTLARAIEVLSDPRCKVSCHYVIGEDGRITQMVAESMRAWHAGVAVWHGETDINSISIGIEVHNPGHAGGYPDFKPRQMEAVRDLARDICARHAIAPHAVLAHSDVAPSRKCDPGEKFDWAWLAAAGIGHWTTPEPLGNPERALASGATGAAVERMQRRLSAYGYGIAASGEFDLDTEYVVKAFQRHFRPARVDGRYDGSTEATLERLVAALPPRSGIAAASNVGAGGHATGRA
jgi:N-acetylmuramoyl-L-alanine amidase